MSMNSRADIEQRTYELLENIHLRGSEIVTLVVAEFGISRAEAFQILKKVLRERGTPRHARVMESLDRLAAIRL